MTTLILLSLLPWVIVLFHKMSQRGLAVFLIWLVISPFATNLINRPSANPFFRSPAEHSHRYQSTRYGGYFGAENPLRLEQALEPTRTLLSGFLVIFVLSALLKRRRLGPFDHAEIWMGIFSVVLLTGVLSMSNVLHYSMRVAVDAFIVAFTAYFVAKRYVNSEDDLHELIRVICGVGFTLVLICVVERLVHDQITYRLAGPFRNPGTLYMVLMVAFFLAWLDSAETAGLEYGKRVLHPLIRRSLLCMVPIIIFLTWARSNYVGFLAGVGVVVFLGRKLVGRSQRIGTIALALVIFAVAGISIGLGPDEDITRRLGDAGTIYGRLATWKLTLEQGFANPVFGIGLNNMRDVLATNTTTIGDFTSWVRVHNSFLAIFAEQGLAGLISYLAIVMSIIGMGVKLYCKGAHIRDRWRGVMVVAIIVGYLTPAFYASMLHEPNPIQTMFIFSFLGAISGVYSRRLALRSHNATGVGQRSASYTGENSRALISGDLRTN